MKFFSHPKSSLLTCLLGGVSAFLLGCVVSVGNSTDAGAEKQCGDLLTHSHQVGNECFCDIGYNWCTNDPNDYECCKVPGKNPDTCNQPNNVVQDGECFCAEGYTWCNPDDADDFSCCESSQGGTSGTSGTTTDGTTDGMTGTTSPETTTEGTTGGDCEYLEVPESCDPNTELAFCTNTSMDCIGGSKAYFCDANGKWVENQDLDQECQLGGDDFAYGCTLEDDAVFTECGKGPGTPCSNEPDSCGDLDTHLFCLHGKLSSESCSVQCTEVGDGMGVTYDYGECGEQRGAIQCLCCDFDEPGCGGGGTDTDTTGGDTDTGTTG